MYTYESRHTLNSTMTLSTYRGVGAVARAVGGTDPVRPGEHSQGGPGEGEPRHERPPVHATGDAKAGEKDHGEEEGVAERAGGLVAIVDPERDPAGDGGGDDEEGDQGHAYEHLD